VSGARRAAIATWLALCFHGPLVLAGFYRYSYDAGTHEFLADHYLRSPFGLWEPRWFGGFDVSSYPPLVHHLIALVGSLVGVEAGFALVLLAVLVAFPYAVWRFAWVFVPERVAGTAALVAVFLPAVALTGHTFGQLPTLAALVIVLLAAVGWCAYLRGGRARDLALVAVLAALAFTAHHATALLLLPAVLLACSVARAREPFVIRRVALAGATCAIAGAGAVLPLWLWAQRVSEQVSIPHLSRASFFESSEALALFFWGMYGVLPVLALFGALSRRDRRPLILVALALAYGVIGLGGTTPLPRLVFGTRWEWLTYDRFALWSAVLLLPLAALAVDRLLASRRTAARATAALAFLALATFAAVDSATLLGSLPRQYDLRPIASFLNTGDRGAWRYQTFGFGDAATRLGYLTTAATIDGAYFTARALPELAESGIGMVDYALWWDGSGAALRRVLAAADLRSIRWAFVVESRYTPFLAEAGFHPSATLDGGIEVWENADAPRVPLAELRFGTPDVLGVLWGTIPLTLCLLAATLVLVRSVPLRAWTPPRWRPAPRLSRSLSSR
jgi:hypothetical protein